LNCIALFILVDDGWKTVLPSFSDDQCIQNLSMSIEIFQYICLKPALKRVNTDYHISLPPQKSFAGVLFTKNTEVKEFCFCVEEILLPEIIRMPNKKKLKQLSLYFEHRWRLQQSVGAPDGSHILILAPWEYHYFSGKGWYSLVLQAVDDAGGLFWKVYTGSLHNAGVLCLCAWWELAGSCFSQQHKNTGGLDVGHYSPEDAAYPVTSWLMKPHETRKQERQRSRSADSKHNLSALASALEDEEVVLSRGRILTSCPVNTKLAEALQLFFKKFLWSENTYPPAALPFICPKFSP
uniref:Uncharacterized protein n=1 Tax=Seriola dumerili TaxID=41447 RepID=A0A3B4VI24_SERDU